MCGHSLQLRTVIHIVKHHRAHQRKSLRLSTADLASYKVRCLPARTWYSKHIGIQRLLSQLQKLLPTRPSYAPQLCNCSTIPAQAVSSDLAVDAGSGAWRSNQPTALANLTPITGNSKKLSPSVKHPKNFRHQSRPSVNPLPHIANKTIQYNSICM